MWRTAAGAAMRMPPRARWRRVTLLAIVLVLLIEALLTPATLATETDEPLPWSMRGLELIDLPWDHLSFTADAAAVTGNGGL